MAAVEVNEVLEAVEELRGQVIRALCEKHEISYSETDKFFHQRAVEKALRASSAGQAASSLYSRNCLKVARVRGNGEPAQDMSFSGIDLAEFAQESWGTSKLRAILEDLVVVGMRHPETDPDEDRALCEVLGGFRPDIHEDAWRMIETEWTEAQHLVQGGRIEDVRKKTSEARCVYIKDHDTTKGGAKSFWLTRSFLKELLAQAGWSPEGQDWPLSHPRIFVVPAVSKAKNNFGRSVAASSSPEEVITLVGTEDQTAVWRAAAGSVDGRLRTWGVRQGTMNDQTWQSLAAGDLVVFYGGEDNVASLARVTGRPGRPQPSLGRALWSMSETGEGEETFDLLYFVDKPVRVALVEPLFRSLLGDPNPRSGFRAVPDERLSRLVSDYGSIDKAIGALTTVPSALPSAYFIFETAVDSNSAYSNVEGERYHFRDDNKSGGWKNKTAAPALLGASECRFIYYRVGGPSPDQKCFFGMGSVSEIHRVNLTKGAHGEFMVHIRDYAPFARPVPASEFQPTPWAKNNALADIKEADFDEIVRRAGGVRVSMSFEDRLKKLSRDTSRKVEELQKWIRLIEEEGKFLVFQGPPGTSKTHVAEHLVDFLTGGDEGRKKLVQFHASYGYEEFMEGLRPSWNADAQGLTFGPVDGVVKRIADACRGTSVSSYLIIDEMNRANLPRVFGELLYLLEYREKEIELQYAGYGGEGDEGGIGEQRKKTFSLPKEMRFLGTMNTADKSIRSVDAALRRRLYLIQCDPEPDVLDAYYGPDGQAKSTVQGLGQGLRDLNDRLKKDLNGEPEYAIGHAFLMNRSGMTRERLQEIWDSQIHPLIKEYLFDQPALAEGYKLEDFWR